MKIIVNFFIEKEKKLIVTKTSIVIKQKRAATKYYN